MESIRSHRESVEKKITSTSREVCAFTAEGDRTRASIIGTQRHERRSAANAALGQSGTEKVRESTDKPSRHVVLTTISRAACGARFALWGGSDHHVRRRRANGRRARQKIGQ